MIPPGKKQSKLMRLYERLEKMIDDAPAQVAGEAVHENLIGNMQGATLQLIKTRQEGLKTQERQVKYAMKHGAKSYNLETKELGAKLNEMRDTLGATDMIREYETYIVTAPSTLDAQTAEAALFKQIDDSGEVKVLKKLINKIEETREQPFSAEESLELMRRHNKQAPSSVDGPARKRSKYPMI